MRNGSKIKTSNSLRKAVAQVFSDRGPLAAGIEGFAARPAQTEMAEAVLAAMERGTILVAEAGTGTGKTFAYLVPALLSGRQVIVSTASRNLQDQLSRKDIPLLLKALERPVQVSLLKGRGNYLCHYRLEQVLSAGLLRAEEDGRDLERVRRWTLETGSGDIAGMTELAENWWGWAALTSTEDSCLGQNCPFISECFLLKARRRAQEADLLVINHHLLCADWALREDGLGELLPEAGAVIVDEAHQFAETAARFLGESVTSRQLQELTRDTMVELQQAKLASPPVQQGLLELRQQLSQAQSVFATASPRAAATELEARPEVMEALVALGHELAALADDLQPLAPATQGLESCLQRSRRLEQRLTAWLSGDKEAWVRWFTAGPKRFSLQTTPLEVAGSFTGYRKGAARGWIFTSATLSVADRFDHFLAQLGLPREEVETRVWASPFDYARQALLYLPPGLPAPGTSAYTAKMVETIRPVLVASQGRAFVLFTSHRALREAAQQLAGLPFPLLVQGEAPKAMLLERFRALGNAVLLGTASFWEGVDVAGSALSCVIIDKLPFASPGDPVCQARLAALRKGGDDPFPAWQLPNAVIALKQGVGRLIRGQEDRGVLVLCDPRLMTKSYGKVFLDSLPPMPRTREITEVERFFTEVE